MIQEVLARAAEDLTAALNNFESTRKELTDDELAAFKEVCRKAKEAVQEALDAAKGQLDAKSAEIIRQLETLLAHSIAALEHKTTESQDAINSTASQATTDIAGKVDKAKQDVDAKVQQATTDIAGKVDKAKQDVDAKVQQAATDIAGKVDKAKQDVDAKVQQAVTDIAGKVDKAKQDVDDKVQQAGNVLDNKVTQADTALQERITEAQQGLQEKIDALQNQQPVMPLNPVACYDFADVQYKTIFTHGRIESTGKHGVGTVIDLTPYKGKTITITASGYRKGKGGYPKLYIFDKNWQWSVDTGNVLDSETEKTTTLTVTLPTQYEKLQALWHHKPSTAMSNTVIATRTIIEILSDTAIDVSGNGNHANIAGSVEKVRDGKVGTVLKFNKGKLVRNPQDFIDVGKQWSHSRWVKIRPFNEQFQNEDPFLWYYGELDYCYCTIAYNGGIPGELYAVTRSTPNKGYFSLGIDKHLVFSDKWVNIIVCVDLQPNKVKKIIYINGEKYSEHEKTGNFSNALKPEFFYDLGATSFTTVGEMANLLFFGRLLTEKEVSWLYHNPQYPVKHYTNADEKLLTLLKNGYIQWNGMQLPDTVFNQVGYRWKKLHTYDTHAVWQLEAV